MKKEITKISVVSQELKKIKSRYEETGTYKNKIHAQFIVDESRPETAPLHPFFDWNNSTAGEKYRIEQARRLVRIVRVKMQTENGEKSVRAYINLIKTDQSSKEPLEYRIYENIDEVLQNKEQSEKMLRDALRDLKMWIKKYNALTEITEFIGLADQLIFDYQDYIDQIKHLK